MNTRGRSPLTWLGALLVLYLVIPIIAFLVQLTHGVAPADGVQGALVTSLITATISTAIIAVLGVPLAYVLARARGVFATAVTVLVALPLALPPLMSGILLLALVGPNTPLGRAFGGALTDTPVGIVIAQTFVAAPFLVIAARGAFASVDPDLEDVARTLGRGSVNRFVRVALVAAWPGVQAGLILAWLRAFGEFGATVILAYHPYSLPVFTFVQFGSTGVPSTAIPVASALGAALLVLSAVQLHARWRRPQGRVPDGVAPPAHDPTLLSFSLEKRLGRFQLSVVHAAQSPRIAILGPSGSGKTLTLRLLAGITDADRAEIRDGDRRLAALPAERRDIGYMPQRSALLPRRTVWQQLMLAIDADEPAAAWWLRRLGLGGLHDRFPDELSGGQQRRVAMARALARNPSLVLLDEPFSALDAPLRAQLARDLRSVQRERGLATVLVTHDPEEAALLADELIVISDGRALQQGATDRVFSKPASAAVASLLGVANTHRGVVHARGCLAVDGIEIAAPTGRLDPGTVVDWAVRAEDISIGPHGRYEGTIIDVVTAGVIREAVIAVGRLQLIVRGLRGEVPPPAASCCVDLPPDAIMLWPVNAE